MMNPADQSPRSPRPVPERFLASKATLRLDALMTWLIRIGGVSIIIMVLGIFVFVLSQILPLFKGAHIEPQTETAVVANAAQVKAFGVDESSRLPFVYEGGDELRFIDLAQNGKIISEKLTLPVGARITAQDYHAGNHRMAFGTSTGQVGLIDISYASEGTGAEARIRGSAKTSASIPIGQEGAPVEMIGYGDSGSGKLFAAVQNQSGTWKLVVFPLVQKNSLLGAGKIEKGDETDLTALIKGKPVKLLVPQTADSVLVADESGTVSYFFLNDGHFEKRQEFRPFSDTASPAVASMDFVFGDVSIVFTNPAGETRMFSLFIPQGTDKRIYGQTRTFSNLPAGATFFAASERNKSFLIGSGTRASLLHATTESTRWEQTLAFEPAAAAVDGKFNHIVFLGKDGKIRVLGLNDPHPEAGWKAFFGKVWYEGANQPKYEWQSTGGSDEFEPKLSLVPLIFGTIKGTLWAMVMAVPIALLAAVYAGQFLRPEVKRVVKPVMEIMASLPSVVLGFLAALWLAPILETRVVSFFLVCLGVPVLAMLVGVAWSRMPVLTRARIKPGREWLALLPLMFLAGFVLWKIGPLVESLVCVVKDPATGKVTADFRLWWPKVTGCSFDQRNSLVVGLMMGFAVIPVIFTIAEDAISNVPNSIIAASHALGASRWQTVQRVVLPVAAAGIFSALMIGLGRAVGETMIVVMATGNTPIMEWNLFNGMRTLAANIAVELPEAPVHSTHYRTLFLGALVLFVLTFVLNTAAELLRQRLREKYKIV
ncbi:MAG: ABC transporter permease subunit [Verrucomicrobia bacterium]|nr:ABC transporter permease subunit [Verrucomicrobiota bacterium]